MAELTPVTDDDDLAAIKEVYDHYITTSNATFHEAPIPIDRLQEFVPVGDPRHPSFVIRSGGAFAGFCCLSPYKQRSAYDRTAELTVYLRPEFAGRGLGRVALERLEAAAVAAGTRVLVGTVCGENEAGLRLMERCGYARCGRLRNVGEKFGRTLDVVIYQKEL
ncbi:MAG: N-acetyltransferase family protein [Methanospirillum sp.]